MNFLVIGQGGREHALVKALKSSSSVKQIHVIPGNPGMAHEANCHQLDWKNFEEIYQFCLQNKIQDVVIGPEDPCVMGLSDYLRERNLFVVGPSKAAAQLEGSKVYAKEFMMEFGISTAQAVTVKSVEEVMAKAKLFTTPFVLKADGLAAGKGVVLCKTLDQLKDISKQFFEEKLFGLASERALLEQFLPGFELSLLLLTNGTEYQLLPLAQDHKQLRDGDMGPNTGGMGTLAPLLISDHLMKEIQIKIIEPTLKGLASRKLFYRGVLFLGLMITSDGPKLLEYNCRLGDPETQVLLPLLDGDWGSVFHQLAMGKIAPLRWNSIFTTCIVLAAPGYPESPEKGIAIEGNPLMEWKSEEGTTRAYFIHAGTKKNTRDQWETSGGRVLCSVGIGKSKGESRERAYELLKYVNWRGLQKRNDIGLRLNQTE